MKKYPVTFSPTSQEELINHWQYIAEDSQNTDIADSVIDEVAEFCLEKLAFLPEMGTRRDYITEGIRFFPVGSYGGSYGVYYFFNGETVYVAHVLHQSQDVKRVF